MPAARFLTSNHDPWTVAASLFIAVFASYVTLDLAHRVMSREKRAARWWWAGGSMAMGTGIWAMHFVGMLGFQAPIEIGYTRWTTLLSWIAAVTASGVGLYIASSRQLTTSRLIVGSIAMATGVCTMHYVGIAAIDLAPGIVWNWPLVAASIAIALVASAAALVIFSWLHRPLRHRWAHQLLAALLMGAAISGMHYTGMAAAGIEVGTVCLSANDLAGKDVGVLVIMASLVILSLTLVTSVLDANMQARGARMSSTLRVVNSQLQRANEELQRRAFLDPLTFLPNRLSFEKTLAQALLLRQKPVDGTLEPAPDGRDRIAVLFIDLDGFRNVNDEHGHGVGDELLKEAARRLRAAAQRSDTVARIGSDEFLVSIEECSSDESIRVIAEALRRTLAAPFRSRDCKIELTASIGVAIYAGVGSARSLVSNASIAMYRAKCAGGNQLARHGHKEVSSTGSTIAAPDRATLELQGALTEAVKHRSLGLLYQPRVDARTGRVSGARASVHWDHPTLGEIPPAVFLPLAERLGLIATLDRWALDEACRQMRIWNLNGSRLRVAVHLSAAGLAGDDTLKAVRRALEKHKVDASQLLIEATEAAVMGNSPGMNRTVEGFAQLGVFMSIGQFGSGQSSLVRLRQLPAQLIDIDRHIIRDLESSADACAVVDAAIKLAHALGLSVVADGVETIGQRDILLELDCDEMRGQFYAAPMHSSELMDWATGRVSELIPG